MAGRLICVATTPAVDRFGEVEALHGGAIHRPMNVLAHPGGKGLNVARSAAALGATVTAVALLAGHAGRWIAEALPRYGVEGRFAWARGETRSCLSIYDRTARALTEFYEPATAVSAEEWTGLETALEQTLHEVVAGLSSGAGLLTISGTQPPGAPAGSYGRLTALAAAQGMRSIVDGYGPALLDALRAGVWGVKINAAEAQAATGIGVTDDAGALSAARGLRVLGAQVAVITLGARGAVALDQHGAAWRVGTPPVDGRYPVGSGDAFLAGLAVALLDGLTVAEAARAAAAAAAANAEQPGAGVLDRGRAAELIPRTEVLPLGHHT